MLKRDRLLACKNSKPIISRSCRTVSSAGKKQSRADFYGASPIRYRFLGTAILAYPAARGGAGVSSSMLRACERSARASADAPCKGSDAGAVLLKSDHSRVVA